MMPAPAFPGLTREEILCYSRHLLIPEVGLDGQRKLKGSSALVIGTGGLGSPVALYLAAVVLYTTSAMSFRMAVTLVGMGSTSIS